MASLFTNIYNLVFNLHLDKLSDKKDELETLKEDYKFKCEVIQKQSEELKTKDKDHSSVIEALKAEIQDYKGMY